MNGYSDDLRAHGDEISDQFDTLADALDDGDADEQLVLETMRLLAAAHPALEDAATTADVIDEYDSRYRAMDEARRAVHQLTQELPSQATFSAVAAAEHCDDARPSADTPALSDD